MDTVDNVFTKCVIRVAQWKRGGPITKKSQDRNMALMQFTTKGSFTGEVLTLIFNQTRGINRILQRTKQMKQALTILKQTVYTILYMLH